MLRLKQLGGSHAASPLRWQCNFGGSFGRSLAANCFSFLAFLTACVRKPSLPRNGAWRASCPSRGLRIPEGHCELVVLSVWNECTLLCCIDILLKLLEGYVKLVVRPNALP